jgi:heme oxygenase
MAAHRDFSLWLAQIERFLERENYLDAIARAQTLVEEAQKVLEASPSDEHVAELLARGRDRLDAATKAFEAKNEAVATHRLSAMRRPSEP